MKLANVFFFFVFLLILSHADTFAITHTITFGGTSFTPNTLNVNTGDTIIWSGTFSFHAIQSTSVPNGAATWGPTIATTTSLSYVVSVAGTYNYQCNIHASMGMTGSFTATSAAPSVKGISITATSIDFGSVRVTGSLSKTDTVKSVGPDKALTISSSPLTTGTVFSTSPTSTNRVINVGSSETETITFKPTSRGVLTDVLTINSDATATADQAKTITLTGKGINGEFTGATTVGFDKTRVGTTAQLTYTITNSGDDTLFVSTPSASGTGFSIISGPASTSIPPSNTGSIVVGFSPTARQAYSGSLNMTAQNNVVVPAISLSGTGIAPVMSVPASLNMGVTIVGGTIPGSLLVMNNGDDTLHVSSISLNQPGAKFTLPSGAGFNVAPAANSTVNFSYSSTTEGIDNATLTINSDDLAGSTKQVSLAAQSGLPKMSLDTKDTIDFGSVRVGSTATAPLTISNIGTYDLTVQIGEFSSNQFSLSSIASPILAGSKADAILQFAPTTSGPLTGIAVVQGNDNHNPWDTIYLRGVGINSALDIPTSINFNDTYLPNTSDTVITLRNSGGASAKIFSYKLIDPNNGFILLDTSAHTINAKDSIQLKIRFAPTQASAYSATLSLTTDDAAPIRTIVLSGKAIDTSKTGSSTLSVSIPLLDFGTLDTGSIVTKKYTISNHGTVSATISAFTLSGDPSFTHHKVGTPFTIDPNGNIDDSITFNPHSAGTFNGTVSIASSEANPLTLSLTGKGKIIAVGSVKSVLEQVGLAISLSPNPMNGKATIKLTLTKPNEISLDLFNADGRLIRNVEKLQVEPGDYSIPFDVQALPSGEYFLRVSANGAVATELKAVIIH